MVFRGMNLLMLFSRFYLCICFEYSYEDNFIEIFDKDVKIEWKRVQSLRLDGDERVVTENDWKLCTSLQELSLDYKHSSTNKSEQNANDFIANFHKLSDLSLYDLQNRTNKFDIPFILAPNLKKVNISSSSVESILPYLEMIEKINVKKI